MKSRYIAWMLIAVFVQPLFAQQASVFTGKVIDVETKKPVALAIIRSQSVYTATNIEGEYAVVPKNDDERITFSHTAYNTAQIDYRKLPAVIELKPKTIEQSKIASVPQEKIVQNLKKVWNKYASLSKGKKDKDFPQQTFYYRQLTENDNDYTAYMECIFTSPTSVRIRNMSLQEGRFAKAKKDAIINLTNFFYFSQTTPFLSSKARYRDALNVFLCEDFEKHYNIHIDKSLSFGQEDEIIVYALTPKEPYNQKDNYGFMSGKLYIRSKDNAIICAECKFDFGLGIKGKDIEKQACTFIINYRDGGAPYPIVETVQGNLLIIRKSGNSEREVRINSMLVATEGVFSKKEKKAISRAAKSRHSEAFWDANPVVKRTKTEQKTLDGFKRLGYFEEMEPDK